MRGFTLTVAFLSIGFLCLAHTAAEERVLCDKHFKVFPPKNERQPIGSCHVRAVEQVATQKIEMMEQWLLNYVEMKLTVETVVIYKTVPFLEPERGTVKTAINDNACMTGIVELKDRTVHWSCQGLIDLGPGEPPKQYDGTIQQPEGILVFQMAVVAIGPRILPQSGEVKNVLFAEFPSDIDAPELIELIEDFQMVRSPADANGEYAIKMLAQDRGESTVEARFDKDSMLVEIPIMSGWKLIETEAEAAP